MTTTLPTGSDTRYRHGQEQQAAHDWMTAHSHLRQPKFVEDSRGAHHHPLPRAPWRGRERRGNRPGTHGPRAPAGRIRWPGSWRDGSRRGPPRNPAPLDRERSENCFDPRHGVDGIQRPVRRSHPDTRELERRSGSLPQLPSQRLRRGGRPRSPSTHICRSTTQPAGVDGPNDRRSQPQFRDRVVRAHGAGCALVAMDRPQPSERRNHGDPMEPRSRTRAVELQRALSPSKCLNSIGAFVATFLGSRQARPRTGVDDAAPSNSSRDAEGESHHVQFSALLIAFTNGHAPDDVFESTEYLASAPRNTPD